MDDLKERSRQLAKAVAASISGVGSEYFDCYDTSRQEALILAFGESVRAATRAEDLQLALKAIDEENPGGRFHWEGYADEAKGAIRRALGEK